MNLFDVHPYPWKVKYHQRCKEWDKHALPYVVDSKGDTVITPACNVAHPGSNDPCADEICHSVVQHFNQVYENWTKNI